MERDECAGHGDVMERIRRVEVLIGDHSAAIARMEVLVERIDRAADRMADQVGRLVESVAEAHQVGRQAAADARAAKWWVRITAGLVSLAAVLAGLLAAMGGGVTG